MWGLGPLGVHGTWAVSRQRSPPRSPVLPPSRWCWTRAPPGRARAKGRDCPRILAWLGRTGSGRPGTHQDGGQLLPAAHVQVEGQRVGQGAAQQQHQGEEDAEVGPCEICR